MIDETMIAQIEKRKRIPFNKNDFLNIIGKIIRHKILHCTGLLTMVDEGDIVVGDKRFVIIFVSEHLEWYNELINEWQPCSKIA